MLADGEADDAGAEGPARPAAVAWPDRRMTGNVGGEGGRTALWARRKARAIAERAKASYAEAMTGGVAVWISDRSIVSDCMGSSDELGFCSPPLKSIDTSAG